MENVVILSCVRTPIGAYGGSLKDIPVYIKKNKIARFLIAKGFESELIWNIIARECSE